MKTINYLLFGIIILLFSCSKDEESGRVTLKMSASNQTLKNVKANQAAEVKISDFRLSFRDVEFKIDESDLNSTEFEFRGPYDVDLMNETEALSQTVGTVELPDGNYTVLRFKLHKDNDREMSDPLYDRSIYMEGTINGVAFEFWHDTSENFDFEYPNGIPVDGKNVNVEIKFSMDQFLNSLHEIDLSQATDQDEDGVIKINPDDDDGNKEIAKLLKENIKEAADLIKL